MFWSPLVTRRLQHLLNAHESVLLICDSSEDSQEVMETIERVYLKEPDWCYQSRQIIVRETKGD
jgi:hypothetical protein